MGGYLEGLQAEPENDLWRFLAVCVPRLGGACQNLAVLPMLEGIASTV